MRGQPYISKMSCSSVRSYIANGFAFLELDRTSALESSALYGLHLWMVDLLKHVKTYFSCMQEIDTENTRQTA